MRGVTDGPLVLGRSEELQAIEEAIGSGRPLVLVGPAGVGKTTLARAGLMRWGPTVELPARATLSWVPFSLARRFIDNAADDAEWVAGQVVANKPRSALLDDLQWADDGSLDVAVRLGSLLPVVATVRSGHERSDRVVDRLRAGGFHTLAVGPLDGPSSRALADGAYPALSPGRLAELLRRAGGNPLMILHLGRGGTPSPTLARALQQRLATVSDDARRSMELLCVRGRPSPPSLLGRGHDELVERGLVHCEGGLVEVDHALVAEVVVAALGPVADAVRRRLATMVDAAEAAHLLALAGDRVGARARALEAAEVATGRDRVELLDLALGCGARGDADVELRVRLSREGRAVSDASRTVAAAAVPASVLAGLDRLDRGRLGVLAMHAACAQQDYEGFRERTAATWPLLEGTATVEEVEMLALSTVFDTRVALDGRATLPRARQAVELADQLGAGRAFARSRLGSVLLTAGEPGWEEAFRSAIELATAEDDEGVALTATESLALALWVTGDAGRARTLAHEQVAVLEGRATASHLVAGAYAGILDLLVGRDPAAVIARGSPLLDRVQVFRCRPFLEAAVAIARADVGDIAGADRQLVGAHHRAGTHGQWRSVVAWAEAEVAWAAGRLEALEEITAVVATLGVGDYPPAVMPRLLLAHARLTSPEGVEADDVSASPLTGLDPAVGILPAWSTFGIEWEALVAWQRGGARDAVGGFDRAADLWADSDVRSRVRCLWAGGEAARRLGLPDAVPRLARAQAEAEVCGLTSLGARARRSLRAAGVSSSLRSSPRGGLTGREAEVLERVGSGLTSAQIAIELQLSTATVDRLISSAVRKLGATNRRSAAARWSADQATG